MAGSRLACVGHALVTWLSMLAVAVANGAVRELTYGRWLSERSAHQLSTATAIALLGFVIRWHFRRHPLARPGGAFALGAAWAALTIAFEFLFFHFAAGHSWRELLVNYDLSAGRVWIFVPVWIAVSPYVFFRISTRS